jgi:hypothetical protein
MASEEAGGEITVAWNEHMAVRRSNLYENKGIAKPLLTLIALLIISPPSESKEPDKDVGFCVATQSYLAASLGCSDTEVKRWVKIFEIDGWIQIIRHRDHRGYPRNRYRIVNLEKIKARAMVRDPEAGEYIRAKNPNKIRSTSWAQRDTRPEGTLILGLGARCTDPEGTVPRVVGFRELNQRVKAEEESSVASASTLHTSCEQTSGTSSLKPDTAREADLFAVNKTVAPAASTNNPVQELADPRRVQAESCAAELDNILACEKHPEWVEEFLPLLSQDETANFGATRLKQIMHFALVTLPKAGDYFWLRRTISAKSFKKHIEGEELIAQFERYRRPHSKTNTWAADRPDNLNKWEDWRPHKPSVI